MITSRATSATGVRWIDLMLALVVAAAQIGGTEIVVRAVGSDRPMDPLAYGLLALNALPVAVRDRYPVPALVAIATTALAYGWLGYAGGFTTIALVFGVWAAVAAGHRLVALVVGLLVIAGMMAAGAVVSAGHADAPIWLGGWLVASFVLGEVSRGRRQYLEEVEQRAVDAERTREEEARRRAGEERLRIARELHDVLAHNISMINVQAGVAVHLLDKQPEQARTALVAISQASKEALRELRATLGVLRQVDEAEPLAPAPGLAHLDELVERARAAGLDVTVAVDGAPRALPGGTDVAAYRIIQESLTNVARHAAGAHASIGLRYGPRDVLITIDDDGTSLPAGAPLRFGNGLTGMRERTTVAEGELEAGPRPEGGFRVRARLPTGHGS